MSDDTNAVFGDDLLLEINPQYDFGADPTEQPECVNPVHVNNKLAVLSNRLIQITQAIVKANTLLGQKMRKRRLLQNAVEAIEREVLRMKPPTQTQVKTLKVQDAYIQTMAEHLGVHEKLAQAKTAVELLDDDISVLEIKIENGKTWTGAMKLHGIHIQTHLSFVKDEHRRP